MRVILRAVLAIAFCFSVSAAVADSADFVLGSQALGILGSFLHEHPDAVEFSYHRSQEQGQNDQDRFDECNRAISRDLDEYSRQRALDGCMGREQRNDRWRRDPLRLQPGESAASFQSSKIYCDAAAAGHGELSESDREDFKRNCMDEQRKMYH